jgi:Arc/MetJ family transcription regulator
MTSNGTIAEASRISPPLTTLVDDGFHGRRIRARRRSAQNSLRRRGPAGAQHTLADESRQSSALPAFFAPNDRLQAGDRTPPIDDQYRVAAALKAVDQGARVIFGLGYARFPHRAKITITKILINTISPRERPAAPISPASESAPFDAIKGARDGDWTTRTTPALDDELVAKAQAFTSLKEKSNLVRESLKALIERESAGGSLASAVANPTWIPRPGGGRPALDPGRHFSLGRSSARRQFRAQAAV